MYTRGFLRNYATYLGLDPDEIEEEWRQEAGEIRPLDADHRRTAAADDPPQDHVRSGATW